MEILIIDRSEFEDLKHKISILIERSETKLVTNPTPVKLLYSAKDVAELTGYTESTIRRKKNEIGYFDDGGNIRFRHQNLIAWIEKNHS